MVEAVELSNEAKELLIKFQAKNQQLQELTAQKQSLELQKLEIEEALKEMEKRDEIYKEVAGLLIKADKDINWICNPSQRGRVFRGLTPVGRKSRGLTKKGKGAEKIRPSLSANM